MAAAPLCEICPLIPCWENIKEDPLRVAAVEAYIDQLLLMASGGEVSPEPDTSLERTIQASPLTEDELAAAQQCARMIIMRECPKWGHII